MTESQATKKVCDELTRGGAIVRALVGGTLQGAGLPDRLVVDARGTWLLEFKHDGGTLSEIQRVTVKRMQDLRWNAALIIRTYSHTDYVSVERWDGAKYLDLHPSMLLGWLRA